ncbi:MAG: hypothetical protein JO152_09050 [Mycobacteriaceae bacterium]|nr:hypothetical protein [Mycobacteriaceae bacterium]
MGVLFRLAEFWWLILPLAGMIVAGLKAMSAAGRRAQGLPDNPGGPDTVESGGTEALRRREIARLIEEHNRTDARWLDYELDVAKLLDFPLMTDMRDPLTVRFHKAKLHADLLRPVMVEDLLSDSQARHEYRDAVYEYVSALEVAESEAIRRRRSDFSKEGRQRLARAQSLFALAADSAATLQERQHAYERACDELDGLIVLPAMVRASIERRIAGEIEP